MDLIKLGHRYINLGNVYQISFNDRDRAKDPELALEATLDVITSSSCYDETGSPIEAAGMVIFRDEAQALRHYLDGKAVYVEAGYKDHLEDQKQKRLVQDWYQRFNEFCASKNLTGEDPYYYKCWLQADGHDEPQECEPGEESYLAWRSWQLNNLEAVLKEMTSIYRLSPEQVDDFRKFCLAANNYRATHADYGRWREIQRTPTV